MKLLISALIFLGVVQASAVEGQTKVLCELNTRSMFKFAAEENKLIVSQVIGGTWYDSTREIVSVRETDDMENESARDFSASNSKNNRKVVSGRAYNLVPVDQAIEGLYTVTFAVFQMSDGSQMAIKFDRREYPVFDSKACKR